MRDAVRRVCKGQTIELPRHAANEEHHLIADSDDLAGLCEWAAGQGYRLCTMVADDERLLEDKVFKIYFVLSGDGGELAILEHHLQEEKYPSVGKAFPSVIPLEAEAFDLFGLSPADRQMQGQFLLHSPPYPKGLHPMRPRRLTRGIRERIKDWLKLSPAPEAAPELERLPEGVMLLPVGPIHAGVIEAGRFTFRVAGEVIEGLTMRLGYKHRGLEKLFETDYTLGDGWVLAERVSGDSSFAHSMAYCQAVESLANVQVPEEAHLWRALFLELERIYNHMGDVAALVQDIAFDLLYSRLSVLRERAAALNFELTGHRLLRGVNRPGGVIVERAVSRLDLLRGSVASLTGEFIEVSKAVAHMPTCRDRMIMRGVLTAEDVKEVGATGFALRASQGTDRSSEDTSLHDFRTRHRHGAYESFKHLVTLVESTVAPSHKQPSEVERRLPVFRKDLRGDVFARMLLRVAEVESSAMIVEYVAGLLSSRDLAGRVLAEVDHPLHAGASYDFGIGYVEGWRGDVIYWVMKGPGNTIFRCKVRDPSLFNWAALVRASVRKEAPGGAEPHENILADFPLINKSFNLSYAGNDL